MTWTLKTRSIPLSARLQLFGNSSSFSPCLCQGKFEPAPLHHTSSLGRILLIVKGMKQTSQRGLIGAYNPKVLCLCAGTELPERERKEQGFWSLSPNIRISQGTGTVSLEQIY